MKYFLSCFLFFYNNEILSLLALCLLTCCFLWDLAKARFGE